VSVDAFRARIRQRLADMQLPAIGFDVRTLHSLATDIIKTANSDFGVETQTAVAGESQSRQFLKQAVDQWIEQHPEHWQLFLPDNSPQTRARWRDETSKMAQNFISTAKNERYRPEMILARLQMPDPTAVSTDIQASPLLWMLAGIYGRYQTIL